MKRFTGLSLIPASQLVARVSLLFAFPLSFSVSPLLRTALFTTMHMSVTWRDSLAMCDISVSRDWDGHDWSVVQSVSRLVKSRVPVDHASVGLAQACPHKCASVYFAQQST